MSMRLLARGVTFSATSASGKSAKPSASTTGVDPSKVALTNWSGTNYINDSNTTFTRRYFPAFVNFVGTNVTIDQCYFADGVQFTRADGLVVQDSSIKAGISVSSVNGATFRRVDVDGTSGDIMHITGDQNNNTIPCRNITIEDSFLHGPEPGVGDHNDGIQVRGCLGLTLTRTVIDMGPWVLAPDGNNALNAALFLQNANGGNSNVVVTDCWMNGAGYTLQCDPVSGTFAVTGLQVGKDYEFGVFTGAATLTSQSNNRIEGTIQSITLGP